MQKIWEIAEKQEGMTKFLEKLIYNECLAKTKLDMKLNEIIREINYNPDNESLDADGFKKIIYQKIVAALSKDYRIEITGKLKKNSTRKPPTKKGTLTLYYKERTFNYRWSVLPVSLDMVHSQNSIVPLSDTKEMLSSIEDLIFQDDA